MFRRLWFQDFGVSVWGKDFDADAHEDVLRRSGGAEGPFPTVDVFLPVCNEPTVLLANTWDHVLALDYPHVTVHVLDDGAKDEVKALAAEYGFECERLYLIICLCDRVRHARPALRGGVDVTIVARGSF